AAYPHEGAARMSYGIVAAQLGLLPIALLVGRAADSWGRKPLFLAGFAILPIRAALYTLSDDSFWLIGVQLLDGVGAGVFGALTPLVIADIMRGTGRYNLAQGAIATVHGVGASLSGLAAGVIVDHFGYSSAFLALSAAALVALLVERHGVRALYLAADMAKPTEIRGLVGEAARQFGGVDVLVNNAGIQHVAPIVDFPEERWDAVLAVNLSAAFHASKAALPLMI